jgi:rare lipoprotein A
MRNAVRIGLVLMAGAALAACGTTAPRHSVGPTKTNPDPAKRSHTNADGQKIGKPYQIGGLWYVPREQPDYDEKGIASWYGPGFHLKATAMGETFDMDAVSAAHTTLPLPSMVEVTNLDNGRKLVVRVNDRGPFHDGRIIDLSREAARQLDFERAGVARVRVRYLGPPDLLGPNDGRRYAESKAKNYAKDEARRYAKAEAKPGFKFSLKPSFPIVVAPPATPALMTAAPAAIAATATAVPMVVDALTPTLSMPSAQPALPRSQPLRMATLPPAEVAPVLPAPAPTLAPAPAPISPPISPPVSVPISVEQTVSLPTPEVSPPSVTPPAVEISPTPGLRIQAGAFASKANAQRAVSQLAAAGAASIEPMTRADGVTLYRVVMTAPADEAAAYALRDRVEEIGFTDAQVVRLF